MTQQDKDSVAFQMWLKERFGNPPISLTRNERYLMKMVWQVALEYARQDIEHDRQQRGEPVATIDVKHHDLAGPSAVCLALDVALDLPAGRHEVYAAPVAAQPPAIFCDEEHVAVPRGLIGAAISAIDKKREGIKLLAELRRYTTGDLSAPVAYQSQNIAETAKRVLIALRADDLGDLLRASDHGPLAAITRALKVQPQAPAAQGDAIAEDDDGMPVGFAGWYNRRFAMLEVDTSRTAYCEDAWRAALKENSNV